MKAQNKNRKHPTCSRCRFHGKKDVRVLQHQCPFRNCTCSSCFLIKRRSIIYRAQKNLDKHEDASNDDESPPTAMRESMVSKTCSDSSSDATSYACGGGGDGSADTSCGASPACSWQSLEQHAASTSAKSGHVGADLHYRIGDFQSLCLTFPELTPTQLQSMFVECGNDFQRTIDTILMTKWCTDDAKTCNEWSASGAATAEYATNANSFARTGLPGFAPALLDGAPNADCDWRSNASNDFCAPDYANDYYYDQSFGNGVMSQQGIGHQQWFGGYDCAATAQHWHSNSQQGTHMYEMGAAAADDTGWPTPGGELALSNNMLD